jgi:tripartite-type tricarboxylate transporter receptor subunit TctC
MTLRTVIASALIVAGATYAQQYPAKPVRVIIPFPPSGPTDIFGRMVSETLTKTYGQQFVPDNRPGAGGNLGTELCARSAPDGYTVCIVTIGISLAQAVYGKVGFDPIKDFTHVTLIAQVPSLLTVHPALPAKSVKDIIALAKASPGHLMYASTGNGTSPQMLMEMFKSMTGTNIVHVPYKGQGPAVLDQISGQVQLAFNTAIGVIPQVDAGKLRAIAISTRERFPSMPDIPTVAEGGVKGFEGTSWHGVVMPANVPPEIVNRIYTPVVEWLNARCFSRPSPGARYPTNSSDDVRIVSYTPGMKIRRHSTAMKSTGFTSPTTAGYVTLNALVSLTTSRGTENSGSRPEWKTLAQ